MSDTVLTIDELLADIPVGVAGAINAQDMRNFAVSCQAGEVGGGIGPIVSGPTGPVGATGSQGIQGFTGPVGGTGAAGSDGGAGNTGASGSAGGVGATGSQGIQGFTGSVGATGSGTVGATGSAGTVGATGSQGIQGVTGPVGASGSAGSVGATGASGSNGNDGATGATGAGGTPAGTTGSIQYNDSGVLAGSSDLYYDANFKFLGVNTAGSPTAVADFMTQTYTPTTPGIATIAFDFTGTAYTPDADGTVITYYAYGQQTFAGTPTYSTVASTTITEQFNIQSPTALESNNPSGAYIAAGQTINYTIYAVYNGKATAGVPVSFTDSFNDGSAFVVDLAWTAPSVGPDSYYVWNSTSGYYANTASATSITDYGTFTSPWVAGDPNFAAFPLTFNLSVQLSTSDQTNGFTYYLQKNNPNSFTTGNHYAGPITCTGASQSFVDDSVTGWTANGFSFSPTSYTPNGIHTNGVSSFGDLIEGFGGLGIITGNSSVQALSVAGDLTIQGNKSFGTATVNLTGVSSEVTSIQSITSPNNGSPHQYRVGGYICVNTVTAATVTLQVTFTHATVSRTLSFFAPGSSTAALSSTGFVGFSPMNISVDANTAIVMKTTGTITTSINYDVSTNIQQLD